MPDVPNAWTDGSLIQDQVSGAGEVIWMRSGLMMGWFSPVGVLLCPRAPAVCSEG